MNLWRTLVGLFRIPTPAYVCGSCSCIRKSMSGKAYKAWRRTGTVKCWNCGAVMLRVDAARIPGVMVFRITANQATTYESVPAGWDAWTEDAQEQHLAEMALRLGGVVRIDVIEAGE